MLWYAAAVFLFIPAQQTSRWLPSMPRSISVSAGYSIILTAKIYANAITGVHSLTFCFWYDNTASILKKVKQKEIQQELHLPTTANMKDVLVAILSTWPAWHSCAFVSSLCMKALQGCIFNSINKDLRSFESQDRGAKTISYVLLLKKEHSILSHKQENVFLLLLLSDFLPTKPPNPQHEWFHILWEEVWVPCQTSVQTDSIP